MRNAAVARIGVVVCGLVIVGLAAGVLCEPAAAGSEGEVKLETLLATELERVEGTEVIVSRVTLPPNAALPKHRHPGEEFGYVLEGSAVFSMEGEADRTIAKGDVARVPLRRVHSVRSGDEGATILVFRVHEKGMPERMPAD